MLKKLATFGLAFAVATVAVGIRAVPASAPVDGTLYGIAFPSTVASIDPASGTEIALVSLSGVGPNALVQAMAPDAKSGDLDALVTTCTSCPNAKGGGGPVFFQLAVVDPVARSESASPNLLRPISQSIAVDPKTHSVWGVVDCGPLACASSSVVVIDPASGAETDVASLPFAASFDTKVALAPKSHTLYVLSFAGQLFAVDIVSGAVVTDPSLGPNITGMAVDTSNGDLFVLRGGLQPQVEQVDPSTGHSTVLATFNGLGLSSATIDPKSHTLFAEESVLGGFEVVSVNDRGGVVSAGRQVIQLPGPLAFLRD